MKREVIKMKNTKNTIQKSKATVGNFINRHFNKLAVMAMLVMCMSITVFGASADALWQTIAGLIQTWVTRLGAVVVFVGGIMFALGWKSDDAEQKSRGISTIIAGAIVMAIAALTGTFFA